jgi:hypothetical protein
MFSYAPYLIGVRDSKSLAQPSGLSQSAEYALDNLLFQQDYKACGMARALDNLQPDLAIVT